MFLNSNIPTKATIKNTLCLNGSIVVLLVFIFSSLNKQVLFQIKPFRTYSFKEEEGYKIVEQ